MGETTGLALVLGRWLDRPGWGSVRRRVGSCLAEPRAVPVPPRLRLETPAGVLVDLPERLPGETAHQCAVRVFPFPRAVVLCAADMTPLDPTAVLGEVELVVVVRRSKDTTSVLARKNRLGELRWAVAYGREWKPGTSWRAAENGHLELLVWAIANGCPWHSHASWYATMNGHLKLLMWAIAHGCPWHREVSWCAARHGRLEMMQWALANGCEWHPQTSRIAAEKGHLELLQWALANDCPLDPETRDKALNWGHTEIVEWLDARV